MINMKENVSKEKKGDIFFFSMTCSGSPFFYKFFSLNFYYIVDKLVCVTCKYCIQIYNKKKKIQKNTFFILFWILRKPLVFWGFFNFISWNSFLIFQCVIWNFTILLTFEHTLFKYTLRERECEHLSLLAFNHHFLIIIQACRRRVK